MRALVVDGYPLMRQAVAGQLQWLDADEVDCAGDYGEALKLVRHGEYDLAVIEICYPSGAGGFRILEKIVQHCPECKVLFYTSAGPKLLAQKALRAGAHGYLHKCEGPETLREAVEKVMEGEVFLSDELAQRMMLQVRRGYEPDEDPVEDLSPMQWRVWQGVANGKTCKEIASELNRSEKTVGTHVQHIKNKLGYTTMRRLSVAAAAYMLTGGTHGSQETT